MAIKLLRQLRDAVLGPVGTALRFDRAPHESGILGRELTKLTLHGVDGDALFGDLLRDGGDPTRSAPLLTDAEGLAARRDGNTVQLDRELLNMSRAAGDFSAAQTALAAKFRLVRYAINEGR